jgi:sodium-dependent dicarboxylate transporter 2/3/5
MLGIAYSASIGGIGTLIGTPPNTLLASFLSDNHGISIDFGTWMLMGVPLVIIMLPIAWFMLCKVIFPVKGITFGEAGLLIDHELEQLGEMSKGERIVLIVFVTTAICWMTRQWIVSITGLPITDTSIALIAAILLFAVPVSIERGHFTVEWDAAKNISWGVLILFGGGLALAGAFKSSGLAATIGNTVANMQGVEISMIILATIAAIIFLTEITSNTATTATFLPILGAVAIGFDASPMLLTIPAALAASMAFMMPVATPPNAIVFSYSEMRIRDMIIAGIWLNIISIGLIYMAMLFWAPMVFGLLI